MEYLSLYHTHRSAWLSWNAVALVWWFRWPFRSLCSTYGRKRLSASFFLLFFFFPLNMFSSIFLLYSFHFLIWSLQGGGEEAIWSILFDTTDAFIKIWRATNMFPTLLKVQCFPALLVRATSWVVFAQQLWRNVWDFCWNMCKTLQNFTLNRSAQTFLASENLF